MLQLMRAYGRAGVIKNHAAGTGSTLIYCGNILSHNIFSFNTE
jgi:hypothetical protein